MIGGGGRKQPPAQRHRAPSRRSARAAADLTADRERALVLTPVSRETLDRLDCFVAILLAWQRRMNLIAPSTESTLWTRHVADSLQLMAPAPGTRFWADLGAGAGFPGLVIACALADIPGARVHLVESNAKKAAFLREAARATGAPAVVHATRIEDFVAKAPAPIDVVTARALAPLPKLLSLVYPLLKSGALGIFPKGQDVAAELTEAAKCWKIQASLSPSRTDPKAQIVVVRGLEPKLRSATRNDSATFG
ncbi:MAG TPA: 16S rRNA (guanine(527)-N(7))-methyltransferase RsmG [Xanthobacteraceae bacterium]|nr:16S rRNA (guanine(527)-N(7))-methyltransferase RsmG [Xanthobacteraceae bacterium]